MNAAARTPLPRKIPHRAAAGALLATLAVLVALAGPAPVRGQKEPAVKRAIPPAPPKSAPAAAPGKPAPPVAPAAPSGRPRGKKADTPQPGAVEVQLSDDSTLRVTLKEERLEVKTAYGTLLVPMRDLERIEFGRRIPADQAKKIEAAIHSLGSERFTTRETATRELLALQEKAYPALVKAAGSGDREVARRAEEVLVKLRETIATEKLEQPDHDVLHTRDMKIVGRVTADALKVGTLAFGEQNLRLAEVRRLRLPGEAEPEPKNVQPDPGNLTRFQGQVGQVYYFRVTGGGAGGAGRAMMAAPGGGVVIWGGVGGVVYGTDVYTLDSTLAMVAVHAGVLAMGQTGVVKVTLLPPQASFTSSTRHGITSHAWGVYPGAYKVGKVGR